jgi:putative peptidoglycan lipid II flippase
VVLLMAAAWLGAGAIVRAVVPGFDPSGLREAAGLTRIALPSMVFLTWAALLAGVLNSLQHFTAPSLQGVPQNLVMIAFIVAGGLAGSIRAVAWGIVLGTAVTVLIQWPALRSLRFRVGFALRWRDPALLRMGRLAVPVLVASVASQAGIVVDRMLASRLPRGILTDLTYAARLHATAYGILGFAISTVLYPSLASFAGARDYRRFKDAVGRGLGLLNFVTVPTMVALVLFREPFVRIAFQHGRFTPGDTRATAFALLFFSLGTLSFAWLDFLNRSFFALQETHTPMLAGVAAVGVNVALNVALVGPLRQGGLALATATGWTVAVAYLAVAMRRRVGPLGGRRILSAFLRMVLAAVGSLGPTYLGYAAAAARLAHVPPVGQLLLLLAAGAVAAGLYLALAVRLRLHEVVYARELLAAVWSRLRPA